MLLTIERVKEKLRIHHSGFPPNMYIWRPVTRTFSNSNLPLTRIEWFPLQVTFFIILPAITRTLDNSNLFYISVTGSTYQESTVHVFWLKYKITFIQDWMPRCCLLITSIFIHIHMGLKRQLYNNIVNVYQKKFQASVKDERKQHKPYICHFKMSRGLGTNYPSLPPIRQLKQIWSFQAWIVIRTFENQAPGLPFHRVFSKILKYWIYRWNKQTWTA